jgi:hypothetical protein
MEKIAWMQIWFWKWADDPVAVFTSLLVLVTAGLAVYTWRLWRATGELVRGADETAKRQLRAYVSIDSDNVLDANGKAMPGKFGLVMRNCGQTPAHKITHWTFVGVRPFPLKEPLPGPPINRLSILSVLHPGLTRWIIADVPKLSDEQRAAILGGTEAIYLWGEVSYLDAFDERRSTTFCFFINDDVLEKSRVAHYQTGNDAT